VLNLYTTGVCLLPENNFNGPLKCAPRRPLISSFSEFALPIVSLSFLFVLV